MLLVVVGKHSDENEKRKFILAPKKWMIQGIVLLDVRLDVIIFIKLPPSRDPLVVVKINLFLNCYCLFCFYLPTTYIISTKFPSILDDEIEWKKLDRLQMSIDSTIIKRLTTFQWLSKFLKYKNRLEKSVQSNTGVNSFGTSAVQYR